MPTLSGLHMRDIRITAFLIRNSTSSRIVDNTIESTRIGIQVGGGVPNRRLDISCNVISNPFGGNVLQAVTRRQLMVNEAGLLSRRHYASAPTNRPRPGSPCAEDATCEKSDLNQQHWSVLLQLR